MDYLPKGKFETFNHSEGGEGELLMTCHPALLLDFQPGR